MPEPVRIAFVITELDVGGAERCLVQIATGMDREQFTPAVFCLAPPPQDNELVDHLNAAGVEVHFLEAHSIFQFFAVWSRLRKRLASWRPHVVQSFLFHANVLTASAIPKQPAPKQTAPRLVLGVRVADPSRRRAMMERWAARRAHKVVCVSESVGQFVGQRVGIPDAKIEVIPNGVDLSKFQDASPADLRGLGIAQQRRLLVFVGRLHHQKGLDLLLNQMPKAFAALPDHDLLLVGDGPSAPELQRLAKELGIAPRVHFAGWRPDIAPILARSDLLLLPSRWEGMPNVLLEAMAAARPVLASDAEGIREVLGPLANDQLVTNPSEFGTRLERLVSDPERIAALGSKNRERMAQFFDIRDRVRQYEQLYLRAARENAPTRD